MGRRKGELSGAAIDRKFPQQVMVSASLLSGIAGAEKYQQAIDGLSVCSRTHSLCEDDEWQTIVCFAEEADAGLFRERFGGEPFHPSSRGRGHNWHIWREPKKRAHW